jgi:hypothetical protein
MMRIIRIIRSDIGDFFTTNQKATIPSIMKTICRGKTARLYWVKIVRNCSWVNGNVITAMD